MNGNTFSFWVIFIYSTTRLVPIIPKQLGFYLLRSKWLWLGKNEKVSKVYLLFIYFYNKC